MITAIIPAAGLSQRMGSWKPMLPVSGKPMLFHVIEALLPFCFPIIAVSGYRGEEMEASLASAYPQVKTVRNSRYREGMFSSVLTGLKTADHGSDILITPADLPLLRPEHVDFLLNLWSQSPADVLRPYRDGVPGHPVLISSIAAEYVRKNRDVASMQSALSLFQGEFPEFLDDAYFTDADTPNDYRRLLL